MVKEHIEETVNIFSFHFLKISYRLPPETLTMKGWLYRRKRMKWSRFWAALGSDNILCFYKDEDCQRRNLPASFDVDLSAGCNVQNIKQGKSSTYFNLVINSKKYLECESASTEKSLLRAHSVGENIGY